ncbi:MAG: ribonuclease HI [Firmicutes bacterium]|nr:ribonuclease HI [Bacillota bacterium]
MNKIFLYTDGACRGNQDTNNVGAWAYCLVFGESAENTNAKHTKTDSGFAKNTTNNIMELTAVIKGLEALSNKTAYPILVYSDSKYVVEGITNWYKNWQKNNWQRKEGTKWTDVKNKELWQRLVNLKNQCTDINFIHVYGHSGIELNELVDKLCNTTIDNAQKQLS